MFLLGMGGGGGVSGGIAAATDAILSGRHLTVERLGIWGWGNGAHVGCLH